TGCAPGSPICPGCEVWTRAEARRGQRGRELRFHPPGPGDKLSRTRLDRIDQAERLAPAGAASGAAAARPRPPAASTAITAASSPSVGLPRMTDTTGWLASGDSFGISTWNATRASVPRLADADAELPVHSCPERVAQPFARLLVRAQRKAEFLLGVDEQFLVDHGRQDRPRQQVADVVLAAGEDPFLRD